MPPDSQTNSVPHMGNPLVVLWVALPLIVIYFIRSSRSHMPKLKGPAAKSSFFGAAQEIFDAPDPGVVYEAWERSYGQIYEMPTGLGSVTTVIGDPKAIAHVLSQDTVTYVQVDAAVTRQLFGDMLLIMEGEKHRRGRRALSPAFSISAIRSLTDVFINSTRKLQKQWDSMFVNLSNKDGSVTIDVQRWMNYVSLDSIGSGGFSHDFGSLTGHQSEVLIAFDSFGSLRPSIFSTIAFLLGTRFPFLFFALPTKRRDNFLNLVKSMRRIAERLLAKVDNEVEKSQGEMQADKSIIGTLIKSEHATEKIRMSIDEIMAQNLMLIAGSETTSVTLTWALIELCRNPDVQDTLRAELRDCLRNADQDPTYEQLHNDLPYLDAFICEILRLRPPQQEAIRRAACDDVVPLTEPIFTASGTLIENLLISKGSLIRIPIAGVNRSRSLWGEDAGKFDPQRWLAEKEGETNPKSDAVQGFRHLLTFSFGPRACLGRNFALTEIKVVISLLVRRYTFELPDGPETKLEGHRAVLLRPKVAGEEFSRVPLIVRKVEE